MTSSQIVTLLTDFGDRDVYVGVIKGAIAAINSQLSVIDLTHKIPPQDLFAARFALLNAYPYFPPQTIGHKLRKSEPSQENLRIV